MENFDVVAKWHEHTVSTAEERERAKAHEDKIAAVAEQRKAREAQAEDALFLAERQNAMDYLLAATEFSDAGLPPIANGKAVVGDLVDPEQLPNGYVLLEAESFQTGNVGVDTEEIGRGIGVTKGAGSADYEFELPEAGKYQVELRYATPDSRSMSIHINGKFITADGITVQTRGDRPEHQHWHLQGVYEFQEGTNVLSLARVRVWPAIDKILIARVSDEAVEGKADRQAVVTQLAHQRDLKGPRLRQWSEFYHRAREKRGSVWHEWSQAPVAVASGAVAGSRDAVSYTHLTLPPTPYV